MSAIVLDDVKRGLVIAASISPRECLKLREMIARNLLNQNYVQHGPNDTRTAGSMASPRGGAAISSLVIWRASTLRPECCCSELWRRF